MLSDLFYSELTALLETMAVYSCDVIITGDFNIHVDDDADRYAVKFLDLIRSFGLSQVVVGPTHNRGHTLDLVITRNNFPIETPTVDPPLLSDHSLVLFKLPLLRPPLEYRDVSTRKWKGFDQQSFKTDLLASRLCQPPEVYSDMTTDELQDIYDAELQSLLDRHAPTRITKCRYQPLTPWFDTECRTSRRKSRMFERRYRTRLPADQLAWTTQVRAMHETYRQRQNLYWRSKVKESSGSPKKLWKVLNSILCKKKETSTISSSNRINAENFSQAFADKVAGVRSSTSNAHRPVFDDGGCTVNFDTFSTVDETVVVRLIRNAANKNSMLDPVPTWIVKQYVDELAPFITTLFNSSIQNGVFPSSQKCACVTPILKKTSLDIDDLGNYRPISNLTFLSKVLERCIYEQTTVYLQENKLLPDKQSAHRKFLSTETAVLEVLSNAYAAADNGKVTLLGLLDQSSAFDCVDHEILCERLGHNFGFTGKALKWFKSYLTGRSQFVSFNGEQSKTTSVYYGVPQGSVLGSLFFLLYTADVFAIVEKHGLMSHGYADDLQIH